MIADHVPILSRFQAILSWLVLAVGRMLTFFGWRYVLDNEISTSLK
ncbi:MAG: hypothetical protein H7839_10210 [Magnetococcus sp. YQC-5]